MLQRPQLFLDVVTQNKSLSYFPIQALDNHKSEYRRHFVHSFFEHTHVLYSLHYPPLLVVRLYHLYRNLEELLFYRYICYTKQMNTQFVYPRQQYY